MTARAVLAAVLLSVVFSGCASTHRTQAPASPTKPETLSSIQYGGGITEEMIGQRYGVTSLTGKATSPDYGYSDKIPVRVGGGVGEGAHNTYRYLNALLGPKSQKVHYTRIGTCCPFDSPNSPFGGKALLEVYEITYDGSPAPARLYFNWYDSGDILIPVGLTAAH